MHRIFSLSLFSLFTAALLTGVTVLSLNGCGASQKQSETQPAPEKPSPQTMEAAPAPTPAVAPTQARAGEAKPARTTESKKPKLTKAPPLPPQAKLKSTPTVVNVSNEDVSDSLVKADLKRFGDLLNERERLKESVTSLGPLDEASTSTQNKAVEIGTLVNDKTIAMQKVRDELLERYKEGSKNRSAEENFYLCAGFDKIDLQTQMLASVHCDAYLEQTDPDPDSVRYMQALAIAARSLFKSGKYDEAAKRFLRFAKLAKTGDQNTDTEVGKLKASFSQAAVTRYLPKIYHETGNIEDYPALFDLATDLRITLQKQITSNLFKTLWVDMWKEKDLSTLKKISDAILNLPQGMKHQHIQWAVRDALSASSRIKLLEHDCDIASEVYANYRNVGGFMYAGYENQFFKGPEKLLCARAPLIEVDTWLRGVEPEYLPGVKKGKSILLYFYKPQLQFMFKHVAAMNALYERNKHRLELIGLVPVVNFAFDVPTRKVRRPLEPAEFIEAQTKFADDLGMNYPIGILGNDNATQFVYELHRFPVLVLINPRGRVIAYHTTDDVDIGWDLILDKIEAGEL